MKLTTEEERIVQYIEHEQPNSIANLTEEIKLFVAMAQQQLAEQNSNTQHEHPTNPPLA